MTPIYWLLGIDDAGSIARASEWAWRAASPLPLWAIVLLAAVGLAMAALNFLPQTVATWTTRLSLAAVRLAGFALILLMLCQLEARLTVERSLRPTVAVLTDTSASMGLEDVDGETRLAAARKFADQLTRAVGSKADVVRHDFDWKLRPSDPAAKPDRPTRLIESIAETARTENNLRAVVALTDGNDTAGDRGELLAPLLAARPLPVFPVVFGSETAPKLARVRINAGSPYVRLGDELRIDSTITANQLGEQKVRVRLVEDGRDEPIALRENVALGDEPVEISFVVKPDKAGEKTYRVVVDGVRNAVSESLQVAEQRVSVLDAKIRLLYLDIPRDERKILGQWIARDPVVEAAFLTMMPKGGWYAQGAMYHKNAGDGLPNAEADLCKYDVIILGDIPRTYFREGGDTAETKMQWLADFVSRRGGGLVMLGGRSVYAAGQYQDSALARLAPFQIEPTKEPQVDKPFRITPTVAGLSHPIMRLEVDSAANRDAWYDLPTLDGNNRVGTVKPSASLLAVRELPEGPMPVIALQNVGRGQVLGLSADTTWRWEMMRPAEGEDYFRKFWGNVVRAIAPDPRLQPDRPQVARLDSTAEVGKTIRLSTRLLDAVYRPVRNADVRVKITSPGGKVTQYLPRDGRDTPGLYEYEVSLDEAGAWKVDVTHKDKTATETILAGNGLEELDEPRANPGAMAEFAAVTGGKAFGAEEAAALAQAIDLTPTRKAEKVVVTFWNLPLTMAALIGLVCLDCWLRKRRGMV
jgi:uncharacterized membrane protein